MYSILRDGKYRLVEDEQESNPYDYIGSWCFSPDSDRLACFAKRGKQTFLVLDGAELGPYDDLAGANEATIGHL